MPRTKGAIAERWWTDAIRVAVNREETTEGQKRKRLSIIADKLCRLAMEGDMQAIKEIGDRLEGRPKQAQEISGPDGDPLPVSLNVAFGKD